MKISAVLFWAASSLVLAAGLPRVAGQQLSASSPEKIVEDADQLYKANAKEQLVEALNKYALALRLAEKVGDKRTAARALAGLGLASTALGENKSALQYTVQAFQRYRDIGDHLNEGRALYRLGDLCVS